ncbi:pilus assembly protein TadG-related protein [Roseovarius aestuarii]|nr:pilus assembly protein TadG-related protein [Roseovarius aestuarii]
MTRHLNRFCRDEDGAVVAFMLVMFVVFLMMGGIGIDTMRHEMERTRIAAIADAASLAGATAPNNAAAETVVRDYFEKIGMADALEDFGPDDIDITLNTSKVTVNTSIEVDTYLMQLMGVDTLSASGTATAEKRIPKLEIALVLDVSGSMAGDKLTDLKKAAKKFVTTMLESADPGDAVISIVPFSFGVTPTINMFEALNVIERHSYKSIGATCIVFQDDDFEDTAIDPLQPYVQQIYTSRYDVSGGFNTLNDSWRSCYNDAAHEILPYSINETALHNKIDALQADGNTSGNEGIKWAAGLLDPAFRPVTTQLIADGDVANTLTNVPASYSEPETQKVIVMMGDGANTSSYFFDDPNDLLDPSTADSHTQADYRGPNSDLYEVKYQNNGNPVSAYFIYSSVYNDYTDIDDVHSSQYLTQAEFDDLENTLTNYQETIRLDWEEAWGLMSPDYHKSATGVNSAYNDYADSGRVTGSMKNTRMDASCTAALGQNVVIYTIGFDVPQGGTAEQELEDCVGADNKDRYYRASVFGNGDPNSGLSIASVFGSIASSIQNLRLTQ